MLQSSDNDMKPLINKILVENDQLESPVVTSAAQANGSPLSDSSVENKYHLDEVIPPTHTNRTVVLCFDGTGDQFSEDVCVAIH
jgi:hypothetical protein